MKWLIAFSSMVSVLAGCGGRTTMTDCLPGTEGCECSQQNTCQPGLVCNNSECVNPYVGTSAMGGYSGDGGHIGTGGLVGIGGLPGPGGQVGTGGRSSTGGQFGSGGLAGSGGRPGTGGQFVTGGRPGTGGSKPGTGGRPGTGASGGAGGSNRVTFVDNQAQGPMTGIGWVDLGIQDAVSSPTCEGATITNAEPCSTTYEWSSSTALCMTGKVPALPTGAMQSDYDDNWGVLLGVNSTDPPGGGIGQSFKTIILNVTGSPSTGLRASVHRKGDSEKTSYCATFISGAKINLNAFNTKCWGEASTVYLNSEDIPAIDWVGVMVPSGFSSVSVNNLCLTSIEFSY
jgi:hypothetical protein